MPISFSSVPKQLRFTKFGPVSQINIQAHPISAETRKNVAGIMRECQAVATAHNLPVAFSCELENGTFSRHTFLPEGKINQINNLILSCQLSSAVIKKQVNLNGTSNAIHAS